MKQPSLEDFDVVYLGKRIFELTLKTPFYVAQTGAAVTKIYKIPYSHRLVKAEVKHCDSSDADGTDAFTWSLARQIAKSLFSKLIDYSGSTKTDFSHKFGEGYEFPNMTYKFITNTTNTDRVYLKLTIQLLR